MASVWKGSARATSNDLWSGKRAGAAGVSGIPCFGEMRWRVEDGMDRGKFGQDHDRRKLPDQVVQGFLGCVDVDV